MTENEKHLNEIFKALEDSNILKDIILIGSWSLMFYREIFLNFKPTIRTVDVDFFNVELEKGDIVLMCSDGLTNMLEDQEIRMIVSGQRDIIEKAQ